MAARSPWFVGVDLAWSARNPSGLALMRMERGALHLVQAQQVGPVGEIVETLRALRGDVWIGVDAPLIVKNQDGRRPSDAAVSARYHRFQAGAHPTNLPRLGGVVRGGEIARALRRDGVRILNHPPSQVPTPRGAGRWIFEAYPHPATIELLDLDRTIKYKRGGIAQRRAGLAELAACLTDRLPTLDPPVVLTPLLQTLLQDPRVALQGARHKAREDQIDAVLCAYIAAHTWRWGASRTQALGTRATGCVVIPSLRADVPAGPRRAWTRATATWQ